MRSDHTAQLLAAAPLLARCSALAYLRNPERHIAARVEHLEVHANLFSAVEDTQGFIARRADVGAAAPILLAFRGSESVQDWLTNLTLRKTHVTKAQRVHAGFQSAFAPVWRTIFDEVVALSLKHPAAPIHITGHSLGGALALLAAINLVKTRPSLAERITVVTFGAPRVGNDAWAKAYDRLLGERTLRFVNEEDPVPRVPFWTRGFRHAGHEVFFGHVGNFVVNPPLWAKAMSHAAGLLGHRQPLTTAIALDHCMERYVRLASRAADHVREQTE